MLNLILTSSLEKILPKVDCEAIPIAELSAFEDEYISFQAAFSITPSQPYTTENYTFSVEADDGTEIEGYFVKNVPVGLPAFYDENDKDFLFTESGLCPDLLEPIDRNWVRVNHMYQSMWFRVKGKWGNHKISITFKDSDNNIVAEKAINLFVIGAKLPKQSLKFTQWFHTDCIASYYKLDMFSEPHWEIIEKFLRLAYENGMNMVLTPLFTPPLDTEIGGERPTVQLLKIHKTNNSYEFDFTKLSRWIELCKSIGYEYFEMPHLFTQWGAKATPKITAIENGKEKRIFGWDVKADSAEYKNFLSQMLPKLTAFLKENGLQDKTYFHISDEPFLKDMENYKTARNIAIEFLDGFKVVDAISDYEFFSKGIIDIPIPSTEHINPFLNADLKEKWCYYCCNSKKGVSNRFIAMPSARNRSIGLQLYKFKINGFLQWGFNFYYSMYSKSMINPFLETDANGAFPSGDAFSVYPGADRPLASIRLFVFNEALQDMRALQLLEQQMGYTKTVDFIENILGDEINFERCFSSEKLIEVRKAVNALISKSVI